MPGLLTMRPMGAASKAGSSSSRNLGKGKKEGTWDERFAPSTTVVCVPPVNTTCLLPNQFQTCGSRARAKPTDVLTEMKSKCFDNGAPVDRFGDQYSSSGSEHETGSVCLAAMVDEFMERETDVAISARSRCKCDAGTCSCFTIEDEDSKSSLGGELTEILQGLAPCSNVTERILLAEVNKALAATTCPEDSVSECLRREVMKHLRSAGYNAAICKARWDHAGGFPGGDYEYVDAVFEGATGKSERILIDVEFKAQFEIARPTSCYKAIVQVLPTIFVGKTDRLQQIVDIMSDAVKLSLKKRGMHLPPWRKPEYMRAKWFSSYKRTTSGILRRKDEDDVIDISRIAVRGSGWDARFTDEMEVDYERAQARHIMKDMKNFVHSKLVKVGSERPDNPVAAYSTIDNSDWQLPSPEPRVHFQRPGPTGLASILRKAGLSSSSIRKLNKEAGAERKAMAMAV